MSKDGSTVDFHGKGMAITNGETISVTYEEISTPTHFIPSDQWVYGDILFRPTEHPGKYMYISESRYQVDEGSFLKIDVIELQSGTVHTAGRRYFNRIVE
jgi:hypothetical protein